MTLEHYKAQEETARQFKELQDQLAASRALCERLQAQADEMRSGRAITSAAQLAELIDGVRCFHDLGAELIAEAVFEQLPDHLPDTTKMVVPDGWSVSRDATGAISVVVSSGLLPGVWLYRDGSMDERMLWSFFDDMLAAPTPTNGDSHD